MTPGHYSTGVILRRYTGAQLRNASYRVRQSDLLIVPSSFTDLQLPRDRDIDSDEELPENERVGCSATPPTLPDIPVEIQQPLDYNNVDSGTSAYDTLDHCAEPIVPPQPSFEVTEQPPPSSPQSRPKRSCGAPKHLSDFVLY